MNTSHYLFDRYSFSLDILALGLLHNTLHHFLIFLFYCWQIAQVWVTVYIRIELLTEQKLSFCLYKISWLKHELYIWCGCAFHIVEFSEPGHRFTNIGLALIFRSSQKRRWFLIEQLSAKWMWRNRLLQHLEYLRILLVFYGGRKLLRKAAIKFEDDWGLPHL